MGQKIKYQAIVPIVCWLSFNAVEHALKQGKFKIDKGSTITDKNYNYASKMKETTIRTEEQLRQIPVAI